MAGVGGRRHAPRARLRAPEPAGEKIRGPLHLHPRGIRRFPRVSRSPGATGSPSGPRTSPSPSRSSAICRSSGRASKSNPVLAAGVGLATIWSLTWVNVIGVHTAGSGAARNHHPQAPAPAATLDRRPALRQRLELRAVQRHRQSTFGAITATVALTLWAFLGLESGTTPAEHVHDPERTIPRATILGTLSGRDGLHPRHGRGDGRHSLGAARNLERALRRCRRQDVGILGGDLRGPRRGGLVLRRAERVAPSPGPDSSRRGEGFAVPRVFREGVEVQHSRQRSRILERPREHPARS